MPNKRKAVIEYVVDDSDNRHPSETQRQLVSHDMTVGELVEFLENHTGILDSSLVLKAALDWK